ncbi:MAG TPA: CPBP family glutamic-type intramembrane protease [Anaeromyxobacter sp.]|nr:CPBP family glutamic-type intramembrane protease [Anaeromyxobacter sp.]
MTARRWFHVLLGAVFVPVISLPLVWAVALRARRRAADDGARRWERRVLWLAAVDTVVAVAVVATAAGGQLSPEMRPVGGPVVEEPPAAAAPGPSDRVVIGVLPDRSFPGAGARIAEVVPGSPADAAGVHPGDVVVELAGVEIPDFPALRAAVSAREPDVAVPLVVVRDGASVSLTVTPRRAAEVPAPPPRPLDPALRAEACAPRLAPSAVLPLAALLAALGLLGAVLWRRARAAGAARAVCWTAAALVASTAAGHAIASGACLALGGARTPTGLLLAMWGSTIALGGTATFGLRLVRGEGAPPERTWRSAVALGAWYLATGLPRVAAVLVGGATLLAAVGGEAAPVEWLVEGLAADGAWVPLLLLGVDVVLLAPVAEEIAFRGLLQPALARWLAPAGAVAVTSALFASAHWYYGAKLPMIFVVAAVLGWARVASGGLHAPIALHVLVNAVNFAALLLLAAFL